MTTSPIDLTAALASFDQLWSPRIVARVNDYDVRIAKVAGEHVWHTHENTDEFFLVLDGEFTIEMRDAGGERRVVLPTGSIFVVPRGVQHKPVAPSGAAILMFEPSGTLNVENHEGELPEGIRATTGEPL